MKIKDCPDCMMHFFESPFILEACAAVAMSNGKTTKELFIMYMSFYHNNGHLEEALDAVQ